MFARKLLAFLLACLLASPVLAGEGAEHAAPVAEDSAPIQPDKLIADDVLAGSEAGLPADADG